MSTHEYVLQAEKEANIILIRVGLLVIVYFAKNSSSELNIERSFHTLFDVVIFAVGVADGITHVFYDASDIIYLVSDNNVFRKRYSLGVLFGLIH